MEKVFAKAEELTGTVKEYINTRIDAVKLNAAEKSSSVAANFIAGSIVAFMFFFFFIFGGIALSFGLGNWIGSTWAGFLVTAILFLLIGILAWMAKGKLIRLPIMNALIQQLYDEDDEED
ncbi:MAG TPA: phage holin family protein [Niabella sp.]|mgnify:CR=1 FL=1|nr:phage holin family protein [Chitinophagaceae bacterium]HRO86031.1 phage holin family protein [Niabella sp.]HRP31389.1 phage holin family protein [Agriterribacter sp.]